MHAGHAVQAMVEKYLGRLVSDLSVLDSPNNWLEIGPTIDPRYANRTVSVDPPPGATWPDGGTDVRSSQIADMAMLAITDGRTNGRGIVQQPVTVVDPGFLAWVVFLNLQNGHMFKAIDVLVTPRVRPFEFQGMLEFIARGPGLKPLEQWLGTQFAPGTVHVVPLQAMA
ncbi:MAG: hypothetical protein KDD69_07140, partial [Bdellovibrionales bacterium]|nr:hypothetical protein [Bdellovibrionales bacterium]